MHRRQRHSERIPSLTTVLEEQTEQPHSEQRTVSRRTPSPVAATPSLSAFTCSLNHTWQAIVYRCNKTSSGYKAVGRLLEGSQDVVVEPGSLHQVHELAFTKWQPVRSPSSSQSSQNFQSLDIALDNDFRTSDYRFQVIGRGPEGSPCVVPFAHTASGQWLCVRLDSQLQQQSYKRAQHARFQQLQSVATASDHDGASTVEEVECGEGFERVRFTVNVPKTGVPRISGINLQFATLAPLGDPAVAEQPTEAQLQSMTSRSSAGSKQQSQRTASAHSSSSNKQVHTGATQGHGQGQVDPSASASVPNTSAPRHRTAEPRRIRSDVPNGYTKAMFRHLLAGRSMRNEDNSACGVGKTQQIRPVAAASSQRSSTHMDAVKPALSEVEGSPVVCREGCVPTPSPHTPDPPEAEPQMHSCGSSSLSDDSDHGQPHRPPSAHSEATSTVPLLPTSVSKRRDGAPSDAQQAGMVMHDYLKKQSAGQGPRPSRRGAARQSRSNRTGSTSEEDEYTNSLEEELTVASTEESPGRAQPSQAGMQYSDATTSTAQAAKVIRLHEKADADGGETPVGEQGALPGALSRPPGLPFPCVHPMQQLRHGPALIRSSSMPSAQQAVAVPAAQPQCVLKHPAWLHQGSKVLGQRAIKGIIDQTVQEQKSAGRAMERANSPLGKAVKGQVSSPSANGKVQAAAVGAPLHAEVAKPASASHVGAAVKAVSGPMVDTWHGATGKHVVAPAAVAHASVDVPPSADVFQHAATEVSEQSVGGEQAVEGTGAILGKAGSAVPPVPASALICPESYAVGSVAEAMADDGQRSVAVEDAHVAEDQVPVAVPVCPLQYSQDWCAASQPCCDLERLLLGITPMLQVNKPAAQLTLGDVLQWFELPSIHGLPVPSAGSCRGPSTAYYLPSLSALRIFKPVDPAAALAASQPLPPTAQPSPPSYTPAEPRTICSAAAAADDAAIVEPAADFATLPDGTAAALGVATASATAVAGDRLSQSASSTANGLHAHQPPPVRSQPVPLWTCSEDPRPLQLARQHYESDLPFVRTGLTDAVTTLLPACSSEGDVGLDTPVSDLSAASWLAVAWYPIYRIPDAPLTARFLAFYRLQLQPCERQDARAAALEHGDPKSGSAGGCVFALPLVGLCWHNVVAGTPPGVAKEVWGPATDATRTATKPCVPDNQSSCKLQHPYLVSADVGAGSSEHGASCNSAPAKQQNNWQHVLTSLQQHCAVLATGQSFKNAATGAALPYTYFADYDFFVSRRDFNML